VVHAAFEPWRSKMMQGNHQHSVHFLEINADFCAS